MHCEIERKYLIDMPDAAFLAAQPDCAVWEIEQVYLTAPEGETRRVRKVTENGAVTCYRTFKRRLTTLAAAEDEGVIDRATYDVYLKERDPALKIINKTRYRIPWTNTTLEIDIYPFWQHQAVLETELENESVTVDFPNWLKIRREVSDDHSYKNVSLAARIPEED